MQTIPLNIMIQQLVPYNPNLIFPNHYIQSLHALPIHLIFLVVIPSNYLENNNLMINQINFYHLKFAICPFWINSTHNEQKWTRCSVRNFINSIHIWDNSSELWEVCMSPASNIFKIALTTKNRFSCDSSSSWNDCIR